MTAPIATMNSGDKQRETLAILVGGGPAPGINGVIASATIEDIKCGLRVVGLRDGYRWLMEDARTTSRWYLTISMGRKSGSLALGMCKSAGATLAVIPEEFRGKKFDLALVVDTIVGAIIKRRASGHDDGVAVIAEGIAERMDVGTL